MKSEPVQLSAYQERPPRIHNRRRREPGSWMTFDRRRFRSLLSPLFLAAFLLTELTIMGAAGYRLNLSPSMPRGIWRVIAVPAAAYQRGQVVAVCPPVNAPFLPRGSCPLGMAPFVKQLVGVPGDVVTVTPHGVSVNGGPFLPHSAPLAQTSNGQLLPQRLGTWRLTGYWLYGTDSPRSFDSRYFGEVPAASLQGLARPVWVRES